MLRWVIVHHLFSTTRFFQTFERPAAVILSNFTGFLLHLRLRLLRPSWGSRDRRFPASKHISKEFPSTQIILHDQHYTIGEALMAKDVPTHQTHHPAWVTVDDQSSAEEVYWFGVLKPKTVQSMQFHQAFALSRYTF